MGTSPALQWLGLHPSIAGYMGSIPGQGTKMLQTAGLAKKREGVLKRDKVLKHAARIKTNAHGMTSQIWLRAALPTSLLT